MIRHAVRIFGVEVIKAALGPQLRDKQRLSPQHRCGELPAPDEGFGEQMIELLPGPSYIAANGDAVITVGSHNGDAYRGTLIDRLQHIGARQGNGSIKALRSEERLVGKECVSTGRSGW